MSAYAIPILFVGLFSFFISLLLNYTIVCFISNYVKNKHYIWIIVGAVILSSLFLDIYWMCASTLREGIFGTNWLKTISLFSGIFLEMMR